MATISGNTLDAVWSDVSLVPADLEAALTDFTGHLDTIGSVNATIQSATDSTIRLGLGGFGTLTIKGSGLLTNDPTVNSIVWANGVDGLTINGTFGINNAGDVTGKLTSVTIKDDSFSVTLSGSVSFSSTGSISGKITKVAWKDGGDSFSITGSFTFSGTNPDGIVKGVSVKLADGSALTVTGLSINMDAFDSVATVDDLLAMLPANLTGDDTISFSADGTALLAGGLGNDTYTISAEDQTVTELDDEGTDTLRVGFNVGSNATLINLADFAEVENVLVAGTGLFNVNGTADDNVLTGNASANALLGGDGDDTLVGGSGNDTLNGGIGADTMLGGKGNDTYAVDNVNDVVTEKKDEGTDTVESSVTRTLGANQEHLTLTGTDAIDGTGNTLANRITGNSGVNALAGGAGSDTYFVQTAGDTVVELAGGGTDTVNSTIDFTLGDNVERLVLGNGGLAGTGNALANRITGGTGDDELSGLEGVDTLIGGDGEDQLDGGAGNDTMAGGAGDDLYTVDNTKDVITEALDAGVDSVDASVSYKLAANVDNLDLVAGAATALNATGNGLDNTIVGNEFNNKLNGSTGNDTLTGGAGNDQFIFSTARNAVTNVDTITDFTVGEDRLMLDNDVFALLGAAGALAASRFASGDGLVEAASNARLIYDSSTGDLYYDSNGATAGGSVKIATLAGMPALTAADITVLE